MNQVAVMLNYSTANDYFFQKYIFSQYKSWLTERNVEHTFVGQDVYTSEPYVVLLSENDATAFKLRFGL